MLDAAAIADTDLNSPAIPLPPSITNQLTIPSVLCVASPPAPPVPPRKPAPVSREPQRPFWITLTGLDELPVILRAKDVVMMTEHDGNLHDDDTEDEGYTRVMLATRGVTWHVDVEEVADDIRKMMEGK